MANKYINRDIEKTLKNAIKQFPAVIITGPRQSGKTTLYKHLFSKGYKLVSMDQPELRIMAKNDPVLFFENYLPPVIIDEIQYVPELLTQIKIIIDNDRRKMGKFLLTGSQIFPLMKNISESLAGRIAVLTLLPLSFNENFISGNMDISVLEKWILKGGFPEINIQKNMDSSIWFSSYVQTYLERDVRQLRQVGNITDFQRFLQMIAAVNGQIINMSNISRDLGVSVNTIKAWISVMEASGQIVLIKPFYVNKGKRLVKNPKIYFIDTGLLCFLTGITTARQVFKSSQSGQLFETVVVTEIIKFLYSKGKLPRIYYWRTSNGQEVDFIIEYGDRIIPLEVKIASHVNTGMVKDLISFCRLFKDKVDKGYLVNVSKESIKLGENVFSVGFYNMIQNIFKT